MRAVTVQQPWAAAIFHASPRKNVENRTRLSTWRCLERSRVAIHAGQRWSDRGALTVPDITDRPLPTGWDVRGAIIGTVDVTDVHWEADQCCEPWGEASYVDAAGIRQLSIVHLVLENPRPCPPIDCRGALGAWRVPDHVALVLETGRTWV
ncbi:hypothetical protein [uncultured Jatrophihabitans sp.]|uniref:hypothetical protein n=1 Tax=uncultured Jatrophihabitans sp. TaxID=1610747 RepID=UPI0035CC0787